MIMIDDTNRRGEQQTIELIKNTLEESGIEYLSGYYEGSKETCIIASVDNNFLCALLNTLKTSKRKNGGCRVF